MNKMEITRDDVQAPLAAPTYLTHVTVPRFRRGRSATAAIAVHVVALVALLIVLHRHDAAAPPEATVALVMQNSPYVGTGPQVITPVLPTRHHQPRPTLAPPTPAAPITPQPAAPAPADSTDTSPAIAATVKTADLPLPAPPAPTPPLIAQKPAPAPPAAPIPRQGDNQPVGFGLASGARIVPARPDADVNRPPSYPREALEHREEGRVMLSIQVAPNGGPRAVSVITSSGFTALDNAARNAVLAWHFQPAIYGGKPVPSVLLLPIRFEIDQAAGQ